MGEGAVLRGAVQSEVDERASGCPKNPCMLLMRFTCRRRREYSSLFSLVHTKTAVPLSAATRMGFKVIIHHQKGK